jgi:hypothetical protein
MAAQAISWPELVETVGEDSARALVEFYGGTGKYIPRNPMCGNLKTLVGETGARALSARFRGETLVLPGRPKPAPAKVRILELLTAGWSARRIALETGTTESWVWSVKRQCRNINRA